VNQSTVRKAARGDLNRITQLLESASLPTLGVAEHLQHFLVAEVEGTIVGALGLEVYGDTALLRSAVVLDEMRNRGIGAHLYAKNVDQARQLGVRRLLLLTNTAEGYFARKGFKKIDQKSVTGPVTASVEFTGACPSHAACMELLLDDAPRILVLCTGNSCRSQMAEHFLKSFDSSLDVHSAGTLPALNVHPKAIAVMKEVGIDMTGSWPKPVDEFIPQRFDFVITVCDNANETCPVFTGKVKHRLHIGFDDPAEATGTDEEVMRVFRRVRDEIKNRFHQFYLEQINQVKR
jgi:arsenate reductase